MKNLYIAGPIKGKPDGNKKLFEEAKKYVHDNYINIAAFTPYDLAPWLHDGDCPEWSSDAGESNEHKAACYMRADIIEMLTNADGILLLPGWEHSAGARVEFIVAEACGLKIIYFTDLI